MNYENELEYQRKKKKAAKGIENKRKTKKQGKIFFLK